MPIATILAFEPYYVIALCWDHLPASLSSDLHQLTWCYHSLVNSKLTILWHFYILFLVRNNSSSRDNSNHRLAPVQQPRNHSSGVNYHRNKWFYSSVESIKSRLEVIRCSLSWSTKSSWLGLLPQSSESSLLSRQLASSRDSLCVNILNHFCNYRRTLSPCRTIHCHVILAEQYNPN